MNCRVEFSYRDSWSLKTINYRDVSDLAVIYELLSVILVGDRYFDVDLIFPEGRIIR